MLLIKFRNLLQNLKQDNYPSILKDNVKVQKEL